MMRAPFLAVAAALALGACSAPSSRPAAAPPAAEFLVAAGDSTYWVESGATGVHVRGVPLVLARWGGRFYEIYSVDDDRSFDDAIFLGQRIYRRDLATNDSVVVLQDSVVPRLAAAYAEANPDADPLRPDDDTPADPATRAEVTIDVLDLHGPFLSFEYSLDVERTDAEPTSSSYRGVVDLRVRGRARLADVVGADAAARTVRAAHAAIRSTEDSVRFARDPRARKAARVLPAFRFDERSFALTAVGGAPAVAFHVAGRGSVEGLALPIAPIAVAPAALPGWGDEVRPTLLTGDSTGEQRWSRPGYTLVARYDSAGETADLVIADTMRHEWPIATVSGPLHRVFPLDRPAIDAAQRRGIARAFEEAALYDENVRSAAWRPRRPSRRALALTMSPVARPRAPRSSHHS